MALFRGPGETRVLKNAIRSSRLDESIGKVSMNARGDGATGWSNTDTHYAVADQPVGPYSAPRLLNPTGNKTWNSQISNFFPGLKSGTACAICDCWWIQGDGTKTGNLANFTYLILPPCVEVTTGEYILDFDSRLIPSW